MSDKKVSDIITPNGEDENGVYWNPWDALGQSCLSYNSEIDAEAISVLRGIAAGKYCHNIATETGLSPSHVELFQSIFAGAGWCEYGTSPRGCWPIDREGFPALIEAWESYFQRQWKGKQ